MSCNRRRCATEHDGLRSAAYSLISAAVILQGRDAPIWTSYAADAREAFVALGREEDFFESLMAQRDLLPLTGARS